MPGILPGIATAVASAAPSIAASSASAAASASITSTLTTLATSALTNLAISAAMSLLNPSVGEAGRPIDWTLDPDGTIPFAAGRVGAAGAIVHKATFGPDLMYYGLVSVLSGAGPIKSFQTFRADEEFVTFDGAGKAVSSQWSGEMWMKTQLGLQPTTSAMTSPSGLKNGASLPGWSSSHRLNGKAAYIKVMGENSKRTAYPTGETKPLWVIEGLYGWDPRLDSSYPGGSGACRLNDPATWVYLTNPILWALKWSLGLWEGPTGRGAPQVDYQVGGIGAKVEGIDVASFVSAANVADANGWTVSAYPTTDDNKAQVLDGFLQAGGAIYAQKAGKISCIQRAAPRTSIVTISAAETAGPLEIDTAASRINRINTLRPRFWSEANRWQMTAIEEVTASAYQTEDGGKRTRGVDFPYVPSATQAAQLAALQIANTREGIAGTIPLKPHLQRITPGDAFTITEPGFVLNGLKCLCLSTDYDPATGVHNVTFVSETDAKYPFALGQSPVAPESPTLTPVDPTLVAPPLPSDWTITPRPPSVGGGQVPGFDLTGIVSNSTATAIIVEYGPSATGPWKQAYQGPPTVTNIPLDGLQPGQTYYIAVSYQRGQNYSERQVYGPYVAPSLIADTISDTGPIFETLQDMVNEALADFDPSGAIGDQLNALEAADAALDLAIEAIDGNVLALDLELQTETEQRIEAIDGVRAALVINANRTKNPSGRDGIYTDWATDFTPDWQYGIDGEDDATAYRFVSLDGTVRNRNLYTAAATPLAAEEAITVAADLFADLSGGYLSLSLNWYDGAGLIGSATVDADNTNAWHRKSVTATRAQMNATPGRVATGYRTVILVGSATGRIAAFRRAKSEEGAIATGFSDDSTAAKFQALSASHALALIDLDTGKVEVSDFETVQAEIIGGRQGRPSLSARVDDLAQATLDGDVASAVALSVVAARTDIAESDIIALDIAVSDEAGARAQAIEQVNARLSSSANLIDNPSAARDLESWIQEGGPNSFAIADAGQEGTYFEVTDYLVSRNYPFAEGLTLAVGYDGASATPTGSVYVQWLAGGVGNGIGTPVPVGSLGWSVRKRSVAADVAPPGTTGFRVIINPDGGTLRLSRIKVNKGPNAADFTDDYSVRTLGASVTEHSLALIDLENDLAIASWEVVAAATGGRPARIRLVSSGFGSAVALDAPSIFFGDNSVFDDATDTIQTTWGSRKRVVAWGAPFGTDGTLTAWEGAASVSLSAMTRENATFYTANVAPFVGPIGAIPMKGTMTPPSVSNIRTGAGAVTSPAAGIVLTNSIGAVVYTWSYVDGDSTISPNASGTATNTFTATVTVGQTKTARWLQQAVDSTGQVAGAVVTVTLSEGA